MWVYTTDGFFSITVSDRDLGILQVRARLKKDLTRFIKTTGINTTIVELEGRDYAFRVFVNREVVEKYMAEYIASMTYSNFKNAAKASDKSNSDFTVKEINARMAAYHNVWGEMFELQALFKKD